MSNQVTTQGVDGVAQAEKMPSTAAPAELDIAEIRARIAEATGQVTMREDSGAVELPHASREKPARTIEELRGIIDLATKSVLTHSVVPPQLRSGESGSTTNFVLAA